MKTNQELQKMQRAREYTFSTENPIKNTVTLYKVVRDGEEARWFPTLSQASKYSNGGGSITKCGVVKVTKELYAEWLSRGGMDTYMVSETPVN